MPAPAASVVAQCVGVNEDTIISILHVLAIKANAFGTPALVALCCSTFDPLARIFNFGIKTSIVGVTAHYASSVSGSVTFNCDRDGRNAYPGVFSARRQVMQCEQDLSAYLRLPCPANAKACTVNYASK